MTALRQTGWIGVVALMMTAPLWADSNESTVTANGTASIDKMPELIRLKVEITANGPDITKALEKLKQKREVATKKLEELGAAGATITIEGPRLASDPMEAARRQMTMMRGRSADTEEEEGADKKPAKAYVALTLQAEWPVKADSPEALLITAYELQQKAKTADLAGLKEEKPSEEEQEQMAEMRQHMGGYDQDRIPPGEPIIFYVAKITDAERAKLLADAVADAKADAMKMAAAAGMQIERLSTLAAHGAGPGDNYSSYYQQMEYGSRYYRIMQQVRSMSSPDQVEKEAISLDPKKATQRIMVMASYVLQPK